MQGEDKGVQTTRDVHMVSCFHPNGEAIFVGMYGTASTSGCGWANIS